jgi:hypothetical protein
LPSQDWYYVNAWSVIRAEKNLFGIRIKVWGNKKEGLESDKATKIGMNDTLEG